MEALRKCKHCGVEAHTEEELELFTKNSTSRYGRMKVCRQCHSKQANENWSSKQKRSRKNYGIDAATYDRRMATSDCCEVCGNSELRLCYDHCHDTMEFRGILCLKCNLGIGHLGDTVEGVQRALDYLQRRR